MTVIRSMAGMHVMHTLSAVSATTRLKEGMLQCLYSSQALGGVPLAHGSHQVNGFQASVGDQLLQGGGAELGEAELHLSCKLHALWPGLLTR